MSRNSFFLLPSSPSSFPPSLAGAATCCSRWPTLASAHPALFPFSPLLHLRWPNHAITRAQEISGELALQCFFPLLFSPLPPPPFFGSLLPPIHRTSNCRARSAFETVGAWILFVLFLPSPCLQANLPATRRPAALHIGPPISGGTKNSIASWAGESETGPPLRIPALLSFFLPFFSCTFPSSLSPLCACNEKEVRRHRTRPLRYIAICGVRVSTVCAAPSSVPLFLNLRARESCHVTG